MYVWLLYKVSFMKVKGFVSTAYFYIRILETKTKWVPRSLSSIQACCANCFQHFLVPSEFQTTFLLPILWKFSRQTEEVSKSSCEKKKKKSSCEWFKCTVFVSSWEGCGGYLHADRGIITSPRYAETYTPNLNCSWHVQVQSGLTIAVHFEQPFQIPNRDSSCSQGDYLVVGVVCCFF